MLTRRFFILFVVCILVSFAGAFWSPLITVAKTLVLILMVITVADGISSLIVASSLKGQREHRNQLSLNQPNTITVKLSSRLPDHLTKFYKFEVTDTAPNSFIKGANSEILRLGTSTYNVTPTNRGVHEFGSLRCFVHSRWPGLARARRSLSMTTKAHVYPTFHHLERIEMMLSNGKNKKGAQRIRRPGNNTEFEQIRQYVIGDDIRTVNWKATARAASVMVNTYTDERSHPIIPVLCSGPAMLIATDGISLLDRAASAAIALAATAVRHYDEAGLITVTHRGVDTYLKPERSNSTISKILEATYDFGLPPTPSERVYIEDPDVEPDGISAEELSALRKRMDACDADADYEALANFIISHIKRRSLIVLFCNFGNLTIAKRALASLQRISRMHRLVVILFEDEGVKDVACGKRSASSRLSEMRFRTICANYIDQQQLLASYLRKNHITVIQTPPTSLSSAVIQSYIDIKQRL